MARIALLPMALACGGLLWIGIGTLAAEETATPIGASARRIEGRVLDAEGWPLPGARVYLLRDAPDATSGGPPLLETTTDADGRFSFDALEPGTYRIDIEARDHQLAHVGAHLPAGTTLFAPLEIHMRPQTTSGRAPVGERRPGPAEPAVATPTAAAPPMARAAPPPPSAAPSAAPGMSPATSSMGAEASPSPVEATAPAPSGEGTDTHAELRRALDAGQIPRAQSILAGIESHHAEDADLFYAVGEALLRAGEPEAALHTLDEALSRDPAHVEARYRRALALLGMGRRDDARDEFFRVLELRPTGVLADGARKALAVLAPAGASR